MSDEVGQIGHAAPFVVQLFNLLRITAIRRNELDL
jgi:hypothetical protein